MKFQDALIGQQVVRSKGDYVVGRVGEIIEQDEKAQRVRVAWMRGSKPVRTWVAVECIELASIPYEILPIVYNAQGRRTSWQRYRRK